MPKKTTKNATKKVAKKAATKKTAKKTTKKVAKKAAKKTTQKKANKKTSTKNTKQQRVITHEDISHAAFLNFMSRVENGYYGDEKGDWIAAELGLRKPK